MQKLVLFIILFCLITPVNVFSAEVEVTLFDIPMQKNFFKTASEKKNINKKTVKENKIQDITVTNNNGLYIFKIDTKRLKGDIKPYYVTNLTTNEEVYNETGARLVINAGFFDPKNHQTVSYVTLNGQVVLDPHNNKNLMENKHLQPYLDKILNRSEFRILKSDATGELKYDITAHNSPIQEGYKILHSIQGGPGLVPDLRLSEEF
ncbi:hypothetical protein IJG14_08375, partial [bacterium]|nr:hypothetical protein [bacterium]